MLHILTDEEIDELRERLLRGGSLDNDEREFLAELVRIHGHEKMSPRQAAELKAELIATSIYSKLVAKEWRHRHRGEPRPQLEAMVAVAQARFGLGRRQIFNILKKHRHVEAQFRRLLPRASSRRGQRVP
jgi:hypothetical protein